jgi:hypothetical protein
MMIPNAGAMCTGIMTPMSMLTHSVGFLAMAAMAAAANYSIAID